MRFLMIFLVLSAAGCASSERPVSFPEQMARESTKLRTIDVESPESSFATKILGSLARPLQAMDDGSGVTAVIDIGSEAPVECVFFEGDLDLASALIEFSDKAFDEVTKHNGAIIDRRVQQISAGAINAAPMLALSWRYQLPSGVGLVKHKIASVDGHSLYCRHIEIGYRRTFTRLFETIVRNLVRRDEAPPAPVYASVALTKLRDQPRGVEKHVVTRIDEDRVRIESRYAMLTSSRSGRLSSVDTVFVRFARRDGSLINSVYARSEDGELVTNLSLDPNDGGWVVSGTLRRSEFSRLDTGDRVLISTLGESLALQKAIAGESAARTIEVRGWYPYLEPEKPETRVVVLGQRDDEDHFNVISKIGSVVTESVVDRNGQTIWSRWLDASIGELETKQLFASGSLGD